MPRLFTGLEIPAEVGFALSLKRGGLTGARWIDAENYHITLRFIGDVDHQTANEVADSLDRLSNSMRFSIRLTHLGITSVPKPMIEAGEAFGATKSQLLWKVELPAALPTIMAGLTQCIMLCLSMVVIAALIGADGLGKPVVRALNSVNIPLGLEAGLAIVVLAIILDRISRIGVAR